jgi:uncharacterized BrkB/YihY/UPF0761 family membrane protein
MTDPSASQPTPAAPDASATPVIPPLPNAAAVKPRRVWDIVLSVILMVAGAVAVVMMLFPTIFLPMAVAGCAADSCNDAQMSVGLTLAFVSPFIVMLAATIVAIVLIVRRMLAFWVVLAGIVLAVAAWVFSIYLFFSAVPGFVMPSLSELGTLFQQ